MSVHNDAARAMVDELRALRQKLPDLVASVSKGERYVADMRRSLGPMASGFKARKAKAEPARDSGPAAGHDAADAVHNDDAGAELAHAHAAKAVVTQ